MTTSSAMLAGVERAVARFATATDLELLAAEYGYTVSAYLNPDRSYPQPDDVECAAELTRAYLARRDELASEYVAGRAERMKARSSTTAPAGARKP